jgi:natural product precursor
VFIFFYFKIFKKYLMKKKEPKLKKLKLSKSTIVALDQKDVRQIRGGGNLSPFCDPSPGPNCMMTLWGSPCETQDYTGCGTC